MSGSLLRRWLIWGWWRKQLGHFDCPASVLRTGLSYLSSWCDVPLSFATDESIFPGFKFPLSSPSHPLFEIIFDFAFLLVGLGRLSQCLWHFGEEMAFSFLRGCYNCSDFHNLGGARAGGNSVLSGLLLGLSVKEASWEVLEIFRIHIFWTCHWDFFFICQMR